MNRDFRAVAEVLTTKYLRPKPKFTDLEIVVFSKDRPLQLYALLTSLLGNVEGSYRVTVLWRASVAKYFSAYEKLSAQTWPTNICFIKEENFKPNLVQILCEMKSEHLMFLVDDIVFVRRFSIAWLSKIDFRKTIPSIRLDNRVSFSQTHNTPCRVPHLEREPHCEPWYKFKWYLGTLEWSMPLSVDGNIFSRREILSIIKRVDFRAPNSLERALGPYRFLFKYRTGYCLPKRTIVNLAINRTQTENKDFPCGEVSCDDLLERWNNDEIMDLDNILKFEGNACHVVANPTFINKFSPKDRGTEN